LAETDVKPDAGHLSPQAAIPESTLPAQATFERIANETGGTYIFIAWRLDRRLPGQFSKNINAMTKEKKRGQGQ
jgi:hypothetical protein